MLGLAPTCRSLFLDYGSRVMHVVAQINVCGMFSFIDMVGSIRDTFTQCIKDILSMVEQVTQLSIECTDEGRLVATLMGHISKTAVGSSKSATSMPMRERGFLSS